ncbi:MAG TPA: PfkB family carbohydrate kinase [Nitrococcus sp.]|nr:PfkB family carbohydrate kinase [Nitrococcus sp.]
MAYALVDEKLQNVQEPLREAPAAQAEALLVKHEVTAESAGGSVANTMVAYEAYSGNPTRMFYTVGRDRRGQVFMNSTGAHLGRPQIEDDRPTGFCVLAIGDNGAIEDEITIYGAAKDTQIPQEERRSLNSDLVMTNINTMRDQQAAEQVTELLKHLNRNGIFALRLSGAHDLLASADVAQGVINALPRQPQIVFGNTAEVTNITGSSDSLQALRFILPESRIFILTRGSEDILLRYEDEISHIPYAIAEKVVDVTGAGDQLMGVTLGELMQSDYAGWQRTDIERAIKIGTVAASYVVGTFDSRLDPSTLQAIKRRGDDNYAK